MDYHLYLQSHHWQEKKKEARSFYQDRCAVCGYDYQKRHDHIDVHHLYYFRNGQTILHRETMSDLALLCRRHHPKGAFSRDSIRRWRKSYLWQKRLAFFFKLLWRLLRFAVRFLFRGRASSSRS